MRAIAGLVAVGIVLVPMTAVAQTDLTELRRTYEVPPAWNDLAIMTFLQEDDPTCTTADCKVNAGGVSFDRGAFPPTDAGAADRVDVRIVDDEWGPDVVMGTICIQSNDDGVCGAGSEPWQWFCGNVSFNMTEGWQSIEVYLAGPGAQFLWAGCPYEPAPTGATTGGVLTEEGGVYATLVDLPEGS